MNTSKNGASANNYHNPATLEEASFLAAMRQRRIDVAKERLHHHHDEACCGFVFFGPELQCDAAQWPNLAASDIYITDAGAAVVVPR